MTKKRRPSGSLTNLAREFLAKNPEATNAQIAMHVCKKLRCPFNKHLLGGSRIKKLRDELSIKAIGRKKTKIIPTILKTPIKRASVDRKPTIKKVVSVKKPVLKKASNIASKVREWNDLKEGEVFSSEFASKKLVEIDKRLAFVEEIMHAASKIFI